MDVVRLFPLVSIYWFMTRYGPCPTRLLSVYFKRLALSRRVWEMSERYEDYRVYGVALNVYSAERLSAHYVSNEKIEAQREEEISPSEHWLGPQSGRTTPRSPFFSPRRMWMPVRSLTLYRKTTFKGEASHNWHGPTMALRG